MFYTQTGANVANKKILAGRESKQNLKEAKLTAKCVYYMSSVRSSSVVCLH